MSREHDNAGGWGAGRSRPTYARGLRAARIRWWIGPLVVLAACSGDVPAAPELPPRYDVEGTYHLADDVLVYTAAPCFLMPSYTVEDVVFESAEVSFKFGRRVELRFHPFNYCYHAGDLLTVRYPTSPLSLEGTYGIVEEDGWIPLTGLGVDERTAWKVDSARAEGVWSTFSKGGSREWWQPESIRLYMRHEGVGATNIFELELVR